MYYSPSSTSTYFKMSFLVHLSILLLAFNSQAFAQWQKLDNLPVTNVQTMAIELLETLNIWVGADSTPNNIAAAGLYNSSNGGSSWLQVNNETNQQISLAGNSVRSISLAPDNTSSSQLMLVAFSQLGIYRSTDGGNTFTPAQIQNAQSPNQYLMQNIDHVIMTKQRGINRKLYAIINANDYELGTASISGLYSATISTPNQEILWQKIGPLQSPVSKLVVDPNNSDNLYIISSGYRIMKSIDGGLNFIGSNSGLPTGTQAAISDLVIDPTMSSTLYASGSQLDVKGFYKSTNSGQSWTVTNQSEEFHRIAIDRSNGLKNIYAIKAETPFVGTQPQYLVYRSQNEGVSWSKLDNSNQNVLTGNTLNTIAIQNSVIFVGGEDGIFSFNDESSTSSTPGSSADTGNSGSINLDVSPGNVTITAGRSLTFNLSATNQTQSPIANVTIKSNGLPVGIQAVLLSDTCFLDDAIITCNIGSLNINEPTVLSLSLVFPDTLPDTIPAISFKLDAPTLDAPIITVVNSSNSVGALTALTGSATVKVGDKFSTGIFLAMNANENTEFVLAGDLPSKGTFIWHSQDCSRQTSCNDGNFTYVPNDSSGGQTEIIQFYVRNVVTLQTSEPTDYIITIKNRDSRAAHLELWTLLTLMMALLLFRHKNLSL